MRPHVLATTVVGSYPQPDWLVDREMLAKGVPRVRLRGMWRVPEAFLEQAQDDATVVAIRDMERAGIDIITDGEIRRESYSNRFATALDGVDVAGLTRVSSERLMLAPDCGMKYLARDTAFGKLSALSAGARAVRSELS